MGDNAINMAFEYQYKEVIKNPSKTLDGHIANENNVTNDYRGRVLYEFFQNAVDRAESDIWIIMDSKNGRLSFANDGKPFSIEKTGDRKYSDFESLCSINTSSKNQNESIGNKGVGFKSCWEFTNRASIVSLHEGLLWGFELQRPCSVNQVKAFANEKVQEWLNQKGIASVIEKHSGTLPSFYFPRQLTAENAEDLRASIPESNISTIITLHDISVEGCKHLTKKIEEFAMHEFFFVKQLENLRQKDFRIHIVVDNGDEKLISTQTDDQKWLDGNVVVKTFAKEEIRELQDLSRSLNYEVKDPSVAIAFPLFDLEGEQLDSRFYTYLPTEVKCGFNVLIHADFLLDVSRKNIDFADNEYNKRLLEHVADLFVEVLETRIELHQLEHFAKFLMPHDRTDALAKLVWEKLTSVGRLTGILRSAYKGGSNEQACQLVFSVIDQWIVKHREHEVWSEYYDRVYDEILKYFCDPEVRIVYVNEGDISSLPPSPPKPRNDAEEKRKLFYIAKESDTQDLSLLKEIESITLSGMDELHKPELLKNRIVLENSYVEILRALASESESTESLKIRKSIIRFIIGRQKLFTGALNVTHFTSQGNNPREGHFLARILLPCTNDEWQPASKCYFSLNEKVKRHIDGKRFFEVNVESFSALLEGTELRVSDVLRFFGATNRLPIDKATSNKIEFFLPWQSAPQIVGNSMKVLINASMGDWVGIDKIEDIYALLSEDVWFYDEKHSGFCKPSEVFLFNDDVVRPAIGQEKKDSDLQLLYQNMGIKTIDETLDVNNEKLLNQLEKLKKDSGQICKLHKTLYKQIVLRLSRNKAENDQNIKQVLRELPLLCEQGYVEGDVWFVGRDFKKFKHHFPRLNFLLFDDEVTKTFINTLARVKNFTPDFRAQPETELVNSTQKYKHQTTEFKQYIEENYLAEMFAIADELLPVNRFVKEQALSRWQNLNIWYANDVWIEVELENHQQDIGKDEVDVDVFFLPISESERANNYGKVGQLIHDLSNPCDHDCFPKFGEAIANGVFRDVNLGLTLRSFLTESAKNKTSQKTFLGERGIGPSDVEEMHAFIQDKLLSKDEKNRLIQDLKTFFDLNSVDERNWNKLKTYLGCKKYFSELEKKFTDERVKTVISQLNPIARNIQQIREQKKHIQLCYFLDKEKELSDANFFSQLESKENDNCLNSFDFSIELAMKKLFGVEKTSITDIELLKGQIRLEAGDLPTFDFTPMVSKSKAVMRKFKDELRLTQNKTKVVQMSPAKREQQAKDQGRRGIAAERLLCIHYAQSIIDKGLQGSLRDKVTELYDGKEFAKEYLLSVNDSANSLEDVINILHVSKSIGDGLGYDILEPIIKNTILQGIHVVEVKTSHSGSMIYLSKNEYSKILGFSKGNNINWRLYHVMIEDKQTIDRTETILDAVKQFNGLVNLADDALALVPDTWVIQFN